MTRDSLPRCPIRGAPSFSSFSKSRLNGFCCSPHVVPREFTSMGTEGNCIHVQKRRSEASLGGIDVLTEGLADICTEVAAGVRFIPRIRRRDTKLVLCCSGVGCVGLHGCCDRALKRDTLSVVRLRGNIGARFLGAEVPMRSGPVCLHLCVRKEGS